MLNYKTDRQNKYQFIYIFYSYRYWTFWMSWTSHSLMLSLCSLMRRTLATAQWHLEGPPRPQWFVQNVPMSFFKKHVCNIT